MYELHREAPFQGLTVSLSIQAVLAVAEGQGMWVDWRDEQRSRSKVCTKSSGVSHISLAWIPP